jgi:hypothetical protein
MILPGTLHAWGFQNFLTSSTYYLNARLASLKKTASITEEKHSVELSLLEQKEKDLYRYTACPT